MGIKSVCVGWIGQCCSDINTKENFSKQLKGLSADKKKKKKTAV